MWYAAARALVMRAACAVAAALLMSSMAFSGERVVLPADVTPDHYRIEITPNAAALTFTGKVGIDITVHAPTSSIVLNSADIVIDRAALAGGPAVSAITYQKGSQTATFRLASGLAPGSYTLQLAYHGKIFQQAYGLFALDYQTGTVAARALFTQFENSDARRFVPCWDEPAQKATFELDCHGARRPRWRSPTCPSPRPRRRRRPARRVTFRRHAEDVVLSAVLRAGRLRARASPTSAASTSA